MVLAYYLFPYRRLVTDAVKGACVLHCIVRKGTALQASRPSTQHCSFALGSAYIYSLGNTGQSGAEFMAINRINI